jgi:autotransporter-associated beta strand protein
MKSVSRNPFLRALSLSTTATVVLTLGAFTASAADLYWDIDGDIGGAGGAAPSGNWDDANWSTSAAGDVATDVWGAGPHAAIFSAGGDAVDAFTVNVGTTVLLSSLTTQEGTPTISGSGALQLGGSTIFNIVGTTTISADVTGGGIDKRGTGNLVLSGDSSFGGSIRMHDGTLTLSGPVTGLTELTFGWTGGSSGVQNLNIEAGADVTIQRFALNDWYYTNNIVSHSGGTLSITGTNNDNGTGSSFLMGHWGYGTTGVYNLSGGTLNALNARMSLGWDRGGIQFNQTGGTANLLGINLANGRGNSATFAVTGGRLNLGTGGINNQANKLFSIGDATLGAFGNWTSTKPVVLTGGTVTVDTLDALGGGVGRVITLDAAVSETAPTDLLKVGAGTLSLNGAKSYTGTTTVSGGTLLPGATLINSDITVNAGGTLGAGTALVPGTSLVNNVTVNGGSLALRVGAQVDSLDVLDLNVQSASTIRVVPAQALLVDDEFVVLKYATVSGLGLGSLTAAPLPNPHYTVDLIDDSANNQLIFKVTGADSIIWTGADSNAWDVNTSNNWKLVSNGDPSKFYEADSIEFDDSSAVSNVVLSGTIAPSEILVSSDTTNYQFSGAPITGSTSLIKTGLSTLDLSGSHSFSGDAEIAAGKVIATTATSLGAGTTAIELGFDAIYQAAGTHSLSRGLRLTSSAGEVITDSGVTLTLNSGFSGGGLLTKSGSGTLRLQGYGGGTFNNTSLVIEEGTVLAAGGAFNAVIGIPSITVDAGAELLIPPGAFHALGGAFTTSPVINLEGGVFAVGQEQYLDAINMTGATIESNGGNPEIRADYNFNLTTIESATSSVVSGITFNRVNSNFKFTVAEGDAAEDLVLENVTINTGSNPISKEGPGLMAMKGAYAYTAPTQVVGGTLFLEGDLAATPITVQTTATLAGSGSVDGTVTVESGGFVAPGGGVESLATGSLTLSAGATYQAEFDSSSPGVCDVLNVTGDVTLAGALSLTDIAVAPAVMAPGTKLTLITYSGTLTGTFDGLPAGTHVIGGTSYVLDYDDAGAVTLTVPGGDAFVDWVEGAPFFLTGPDAAKDADPDGDGIPNAVEFVLGGNPATVSNLDLMPTLELATEDLGAGSEDYIKFTFRRVAASAYLGPVVQTTADLAGTWQAAEDGEGGVVVQVTSEFYPAAGAVPAADRVVVYIPRPATGPFFGRLAVPSL